MSAFTTAIHRYVDRGHVLQFRAFADEAARLAETYVEASVGRVYRQEDDGSFWLLLAHDPQSWTRIDLQASVEAAIGANTQLAAGCFFPSSIVGEWFDNSWNGSAVTTRAGVASRLELGPLIMSSRTRIDEVGVFVATGVAASSVKICVYSSDVDGWPDAVLYESAEILTETSSALASIACNLVFEKGVIYWVGCRYSSTQTISVLGVASCRTLGRVNATATTQATVIRRGATYGNPLPDPFVMTGADRTANAGPPSIRMRVAAL